MHELKAQLDKALWTTKGSRFKCHSKYRSLHGILKFFNIFLAFAMICIAIYRIGGFSLLDNVYDKQIDVLLLVASIYVFTSSIYLPMLEMKIKILYSNATSLSYLLRRLKVVDTKEEISNVSKKYHKLEKMINHDEIDYKLWASDNFSINRNDNVKCNYFQKIYLLMSWHFYSKFPIVIFVLLILFSSIIINE